jgi:CheY-like chemotaxis protein
MTGNRWILLAEDNANDADLTVRALSAEEPSGEVVVAGDGEEALDCLWRRGSFQSRDDDPPAVVLLDLKMPNMDGLEVLRKIKNTAAFQSIPVVVFTSSRERSDLVQAYQLGANAYVVKPVDFKEFLAVLKDLKKFWLMTNEPPPGNPAKAVDAPARPAQPQLTPAA